MTLTFRYVLCTYIFSFGPQNCSMSYVSFCYSIEKNQGSEVKRLAQDHPVSRTQVCVILKTMPSLLYQASRLWQGGLKARVHAFTFKKSLALGKSPVDQQMS